MCMPLVLLLWRTPNNTGMEINKTLIAPRWTGAKNKYLSYKEPLLKSLYIFYFTYNWDFP